MGVGLAQSEALPRAGPEPAFAQEEAPGAARAALLRVILTPGLLRPSSWPLLRVQKPNKGTPKPSQEPAVPPAAWTAHVSPEVLLGARPSLRLTQRGWAGATPLSPARGHRRARWGPEVLGNVSCGGQGR